MAYSKKLYDKAGQILSRRRSEAEDELEKRQRQLRETLPGFAEIERAQRANMALVPQNLGKANAINEIIERGQKLSREKEELLVASGYPADYLNAPFVCKKCEDTGYVNGYACDCRKKILSGLAFEELAKFTPIEKCTFESFKLDFYPEEPFKRTTIRKQMTDALNFCKDYSHDFSKETSASIFMYGPTGLGKTHLSLAIAAEVLAKGFGVVYGSAQTIFSKLEEEKFGKTPGENTLSSFTDCDLLIIDDLGSEFSTSFTVAALYNLINQRMLESKPTIISTNLELNEFEEKYTQRIASRVFGTYTLAKFCGYDIRQKKIRKEH
jgi:DNA replication protein DnaC